MNYQNLALATMAFILLWTIALGYFWCKSKEIDNGYHEIEYIYSQPEETTKTTKKKSAW